MPFFRFSIADGTPVPQPEPIELEGVREAKAHAVLLAGQMLKDAGAAFWNDSHWSITVSTTDGLTIAVIDIDGSSAPVTN
jgi:hypothetical protein